jgi:hypothetical protein
MEESCSGNCGSVQALAEEERYLVDLVCLVYLVHLVYPVSLVQPNNKTNQTNQINQIDQTNQITVKEGYAIVSKSAPSSPVRRPTGTKCCSSAATPTLSLDAGEAPRRRLVR